jgi:hypothetical protein
MNNDVEAIGGIVPRFVERASPLRPEDTDRPAARDATLHRMFHVELRQFPHLARAFNLTTEELQERIIAPWVAGQMVDWGDRRWAPERARLTIYEGPALRPDEIGLGRGWANATRGGEDVTGRVLADAQQPSPRDSSVELFKQELLGLCGAGRIDIREAMRLASATHPEWRVSDRLALAEQAIWELLHAGALRIAPEGAEDPGALRSEQWQQLLLAWSTWADHGAPRVFLCSGEPPAA